MSLLIIFSLITFLFYYLACFDFVNSNKKLLLIICFVVSAFILRSVIDPVLNNDFYLYYNFKIFHKPTSFLSYLIKEPYLYSVYAFFSVFSKDKAVVFSCLYWFNNIITTVFFVWLIQLKDIEVWKKVLLFSIYYFFFSFVLLRNGPVYLLFALYFYYSFRNLKFNYVLATPFMHISAVLMLVVYFHKWKNYYLFFVIICVVSPISFLLLKPYLQNVVAFHNVLSKINHYMVPIDIIGLAHWLFFGLISILLSVGVILYKKQMWHPILITLVFYYYITFFINPIMAFRFSPYLLFALLFMNFGDLKKSQAVKVLNLSSVFLFTFFLFALYRTHHL